MGGQLPQTSGRSRSKLSDIEGTVPKILHTADWQIGLKAKHVATVADRVRTARLDAARSAIAAANGNKVDAVVIAGDLFEDNLVEDRLVHEIVQVLGQAKAPVFVLPGNHDAYSQDSVYRRASWKNRPQNVVLLETTDLVPVPGSDLVLLPAPLRQRKGFQDPTGGLPTPPTGKTVVVGVAHGSLRIEGKYSPDDFPISLDAAARVGVDYLALGHWHGQYVHDERTAYAGTHETTSFGEANSGRALLVEIASRGLPPRIEPVETGRLAWKTFDLDASAGAAAVTALRTQVDALPSPKDTLVRVRTAGVSDDDVAAALHDLEEELSAKLLYARIERGDVPAAAAQGHLKEVAEASPLVASILAELAGSSAGPGSPPSEVSAAARHLLGLLALEVWK